MQRGRLPLAPKQVAPRNVPASRAVPLRFVACPLPPLLGRERHCKAGQKQSSGLFLASLPKSYARRAYAPPKTPYSNAINKVFSPKKLCYARMLSHSRAVCGHPCPQLFQKSCVPMLQTKFFLLKNFVLQECCRILALCADLLSAITPEILYYDARAA